MMNYADQSSCSEVIKEVKTLLSKRPLLPESHFFLAIVICVLAQDIVEIRSYAMEKLRKVFNGRKASWDFIARPQKAGIIFGLLNLLGDWVTWDVQFGTLYYDVKEEVLSILEDMFINASRNSFESSFYDVIKDFDGSKKEFYKSVEMWIVVDDRRTVKLGSMIRVFNLIINIMREFAYDVILVERGWIYLNSWIMCVGNEQLALLAYFWEKINSFFSEAEFDDILWKWVFDFTLVIDRIERVVNTIEKESILSCYALYNEHKQNICNSFLIRFMLLGCDEVNSIIIATVQFKKDAQTWGAGGTIGDRILIILEEQGDIIEVKISALRLVFGLISEVDDVFFEEQRLLWSSTIRPSFYHLAETLANILVTGISTEAQIIAGETLKKFLSKSYCRSSYNTLQDILEDFKTFAQSQEVKALVIQCLGIMKS